MHKVAQQIALQEPELADEERAAARDEEFTALVRRRSRFVFRVAYSILRIVQDSDDVGQETFLKVYRSNAWERMDDEKAYLARTAWRIAVKQLGRGPMMRSTQILHRMATVPSTPRLHPTGMPPSAA